MTREHQALVERVRELVADEPNLREVSMFGGCAVMVNGKLIVSADKSGRLLVRVDPRQHESLLREKGAEQAVMGQARAMGRGWISVSPQALLDDRCLAFWVDKAMTYNRRIGGC